MGNKQSVVSEVEYDADVSYAVGCNPEAKADDEAKPKRDDASKVIAALTEKSVVPTTNIKLLEANQCTFENMEREIQTLVKKVSANGIFFLHFCGHGTYLESEKTSQVNKYGLTPFSGPLVTATHMKTWLQSCIAKCVIISIDCCFAAGFAEELTVPSLGSFSAGARPIYVMASCTANQKAVALYSPLGNAIFSYCFSHVIRSTKIHDKKFPVKEIYDRSEKITKALSSLIVKNAEGRGLKDGGMDTEMFMENLSGNFKVTSTLQKLKGMLTKSPVVDLHSECKSWIKGSKLHLKDLKREGILELCVTTVLCCMMYSAASIQLHFIEKLVESPDICIRALIDVVKTVLAIHDNVDFEEEDYRRGLRYYYISLEHAERDVDDSTQWINEFKID